MGTLQSTRLGEGGKGGREATKEAPMNANLTLSGHGMSPAVDDENNNSKYLGGPDFDSTWGPYESFGRTNTAKLHTIAVRTLGV